MSYYMTSFRNRAVRCTTWVDLILAHRNKTTAKLTTLKFRANETYVTVQPVNRQENTIREFTVSADIF